jgi:hypothetical protein
MVCYAGLQRWVGAEELAKRFVMHFLPAIVRLAICDEPKML